MDQPYDALVIGSGPAGVSAAFPLLHAGQRVAMIDGGRTPGQAPPQQPFLAARTHERDQWHWMLGRDFHALRMREAVSPKLRAPTQAFAFEGFSAANRVAGDDFIAVGSMAVGGLSNAWGCGVARFARDEAALPFPIEDLEASYAAVAARVGLSGGTADDLSDYFGLDALSAPPLPVDGLHAALLGRYAQAAPGLRDKGFRLGRSRVAVLGQARGERQGCDLSGNCLFGCHRGAMYSAAQDVAALTRQAGFRWLPGTAAQALVREGEHWAVRATAADGAPVMLRARRILVAAGTLGSTALLARTLQLRTPLRIFSSPTAAFLLWLPARTGAARVPAFGLGQLSFTQALQGGGTGFGSTFSTTGLPLWEFARHLPLARRPGMQLLRHLLGSCVVGNLFLPGRFSNARASLDTDGVLRVSGALAPEAGPVLAQARADLQRAWRRLGAWMLPGSFTVGPAGSDIHYAGTFPMTREPGPGQSSVRGEVHGLPQVFVVDGACLPALPEKSHTLTIMANADRIGRLLANSYP